MEGVRLRGLVGQDPISANLMLETELSLFPEGWQQQARQAGAIERQRGITSPEALLRLFLLHVAIDVWANRVCDCTSAVGHIELLVFEVSVKKAGQCLHKPER